MHALILYLFLFATGNIEMGPPPPDYGGWFSQIIKNASMRLVTVAEKRPLKLAAWNDSLAKTAMAARALAMRADHKEVWRYLEDARKSYEGNSFAILLEAVTASSDGDIRKANALFEEFLLKSRTFSEFEESFLRWGEFHVLRRLVYNLLTARGVSFEGREKEIRVRVPYEEFFRYVMNPGRSDWSLNVVFLFLILGGGALLSLAGLKGVDFFKPLAGNLFFMYIAVWIAYGIWIYDLAFGLPFGWSRFHVISVFLLVTTVTVSSLEFYIYWQENKGPLEKGTRRCPHCHKMTLEVLIECPHCRKKLDMPGV